jgi:chromosome segregation ATPase
MRLEPITSAIILVGAFALFAPCAVSGQQPAVGRQKSPRLSTDDVLGPVAQPLAESKEAKAEGAEAKPGAKKGSEAKISAEELAWRERVKTARARAKDLQRAAEEAELRITELRNELGASGQSAAYRNNTAAELEQAGKRAVELRAEARAAADDLNELLDYGKQKGFTEAAEPKPESEDGKPNEEYYRSRLAELTEQIDGAQRQIQLYDNRVRDISQRILMNGGKKGGDNFYILQLQQDRQDARQKLDDAKAALVKAQSDLDALREEARRAGVSPSLFR